MDKLYYIKIIIIIILVIHAPRIYAEMNTIIKQKGQCHNEDYYYQKKNERKLSRIISVDLFTMMDQEWNIYLKNTIPRLIKFIKIELRKYINGINDEELIKIDNNALINMDIGILNNSVLCIVINNDRKFIKVMMNQEYCSEYFMIKYGEIIYNTSMIEINKFPQIPFYAEYCVLKMLLSSSLQNENSLHSTKNDNDVMRFNLFFEISKKYVNSNNYIIWKTLNILSNGISKNRILNVLIVNEFNKKNNIQNNTGVIYVKWIKENFTYVEFDKYMTKRKYQMIGSNFYSRTMVNTNHASKIREKCDILFTVKHYKDVKYKPSFKFMTFTDSFEYSINCSGVGYDNQAIVSVSVSSKELDISTILNNLDDTYSAKLFLPE